MKGRRAKPTTSKRRTIYVVDEDQELFQRAAAENNLSALVAKLLRAHYEGESHDTRGNQSSAGSRPEGLLE